MQFSRTIETSKGRVTFYFNKINSKKKVHYHISTVEKNKAVIILMKLNKRGELDNELSWRMP